MFSGYSMPKFARAGNKIIISGRAIPEDASLEWYPFIYELETFKGREIHIEFKLDYYNTASTFYLRRIFTILEKMAMENKKVTVDWFYMWRDEVMEEAGNDFKDMHKKIINFNLKQLT